MPTYEYACKACDHRFEIVQSFAEDALTTCPDCEQDALRKVYNAAGIIFKGDGWHIKDYAAKGSNSSTADSSSSTADDGSSGSGGGGGSDATPPKAAKKAKKPKKADGSSDSAAKPAAN